MFEGKLIKYLLRGNNSFKVRKVYKAYNYHKIHSLEGQLGSEG